VRAWGYALSTCLSSCPVFRKMCQIPLPASYCTAVYGEVSYPPWQYTLRSGRYGQSDYFLNAFFAKVRLLGHQLRLWHTSVMVM
jgi:hypothetical protein